MEDLSKDVFDRLNWFKTLWDVEQSKYLKKHEAHVETIIFLLADVVRTSWETEVELVDEDWEVCDRLDYEVWF